MSRLTKVSIDSVLYDIGSKGINSYATLSELVNEKVSELYDGCIAWCSENSKYYQWLSTNEIISIYGRWRELEFGSEFQVDDPNVDASTEKYKGKIIQYVGIDDVTSGFKRGCFYESRLSNVINYVVATVDASTVGMYYTLDDEGNYNPITFIGDGVGYDPTTTYYKKQEVEVYSWAYINSLKVETEFDKTSENAIANGVITQKFEEVIQDYTDKNDVLKNYVDTNVTNTLKQYADDLIADVEEVTVDKVWSNSKTKDYVDTTLENYTKSATEILQADYDALTDEGKLANNYHCTDSGRLYYKGILYGDKKPIELTFEEYKQLEVDGKVEADVDYVIVSNESGVSSGFLLSDIDTNHGSSNVSTYEVIETLKSDVDKKAEILDSEKNDVNTWSSNKIVEYIDNKAMYISDESDTYINEPGNHCTMYFTIYGNTMTIFAIQRASNDGKIIGIKYPLPFKELPTIKITYGTPAGNEVTTINTLTEWRYDQNYGDSTQNEMHFMIQGKI